MSKSPVLELKHVTKEFKQDPSITSTIRSRLFQTSPDVVHAVDDASLTLKQGQVQGIIGESGCGKTTLLKTIAGLHEPTSGAITFRGEDTAGFDRADWKRYRRNVQVIFQDPFNSLDPKFSVRDTLREPLEIHDVPNPDERIYETLKEVKLNPPERYINQFPNELSGGEKQRVSIARALILEPDVILADEPVSMLDVSTQAAILDDLHEITTQNDVAMLYISHDLSTVSYICNRVNVMYLGRIVESAATKQLIDDPQHPYTQALISAIPIPDPFAEREWTQLEGTPGDAVDLPEGCRFKDRCPERMPICDVQPNVVRKDDEIDHEVACHLYYDHEQAAPHAAAGGEGHQ